MRPKLTAVVGGYQPFAPFGVVLLVSSLACGLAGHLGAVRLLYGMGGDNLLPRRIFGHLDVERGKSERQRGHGCFSRVQVR
jgi:amino acid transporter